METKEIMAIETHPVQTPKSFFQNGAAPSSEEVREVVRYIRCLAMPDPFDERPVMHQKELTQAADLIERLAVLVPATASEEAIAAAISSLK